MNVFIGGYRELKTLHEQGLVEMQLRVLARKIGKDYKRSLLVQHKTGAYFKLYLVTNHLL